MEDRNAPLQYRLCHLPRFDPARFYRAATGAPAPSSIGDSHCREIGGARAKRLRARPRADAHLCELSAPRLDLRPRGKPGRGRRVLRSRNPRVPLPLGGATHEKARVVKDGNVITAAGVSSGIDFAFIVATEIAGETTARTIQLGIEYDPAPPFDSGSPDRASAAIKSAVLAEGYDESMSAYRAGTDKAARL